MKEKQGKESIFNKLKDLFSKRRFSYSLSSIAILFVLVFTVIGLISPNNNTPYSVIAIDVNPSVVIELDENDRVTNVITGNEDAIIIIGDMDLIGVDSDVAIFAIIGSMLTNGYISDLSNSILLSVQSSDQVKQDEFINSLTQTINNLLTGSSINGSIVTQTLNLNNEVYDLAEELNISVAKAELILRIIDIDPRMSKESLALISINDLNLLLESKNYAIESVKHTGSASTLSIITKEDAYNTALNVFSLSSLDVIKYEVELEQEDGFLVYEVDIETTSSEYKVVLNAKTGTIISSEQDKDQEIDIPEDIELLSIEELLSIISTKLNLNQSIISEPEYELNEENTYLFYDLAFTYGSIEYELEVDAITGYIYSNSQDESGYDFDDEDEE
jgi:uncharacterized membrane protein YkoI